MQETVNLVRPKHKLFVALDGVGSRAKLKRRYRPFKQSEIGEKKIFDASLLQPGSEFMVKLEYKLRNFVSMKRSTDPLWKLLEVIISGHLIPGEAEHKIVEFIRYQKSQPGYKPKTRHCLSGLDADLMILGLCLHEPYLSVLREEVVIL